MKIHLNQCMLLGLMVFLIGIWVAAPSMAADLNDPRAEKLALAIGYAMSNQQDRAAGITSVQRTPALSSVEGTIADPDFYLAGAYVRSFEIDHTKGRLSGLVYHRDGLSRLVMSRFDAAFQEADKLVITDLSLTPKYTPNPRSTMFFVPAEHAPAAGFNDLSFKAALLKANKFGISEEDQKADSKPNAYTVVAFMMDRQPPEVQMGLVQENAPGRAEEALGQNGKNEDGWCYAVLPATFAYNRGAEVLFNIFLREGQSSWLANTYSSHSLLKRTQRALAQRGYNPGVADGQMGTKTRTAIQRFQQQQGIVVDGQPSPALLTLLGATENPPGVELAQASLKVLGYDPGPVDGQMGQKTADALRAYQKACGLPSDGVLSAELLCHLAGAAGPLPVGHASTARAKVKRFESRMWPNQLATP